MKKAKPWWLKGRHIARHLAEWKGHGPFTLRVGQWQTTLRDAEGRTIYPSLLFHGNSKQRRQQRRALLRYLNEE